MRLGDFQKQIEEMYLERESARGSAGTFMWFTEEVGELARALRRQDEDNLKEEFADCLAWLCSLASIAGVDMEEAALKYAHGCPVCGKSPCTCPSKP